jgi:hypothetical protein
MKEKSKHDEAQRKSMPETVSILELILPKFAPELHAESSWKS